MKNLLNDKPTDKSFSIHPSAIEFINLSDIKGKNVLDIGCGYGWFELFAISKGVKNITGIDINNETINVAKKCVKNKKVKFQVENAVKLPFNDNAFDTIVSIETLEHITRNTELKMYSEIARVLKKDGILYISTPYSSFIATFFDPAWWLIGHRHYSKEQLIMFGRKNKLRMTEAFIKGSWWSLLSGLNMYIAKWIFRRRRFYEDFFIKKSIEDSRKKNGFLGIQVKYKKIKYLHSVTAS